MSVLSISQKGAGDPIRAACRSESAASGQAQPEEPAGPEGPDGSQDEFDEALAAINDDLNAADEIVDKAPNEIKGDVEKYETVWKAVSDAGDHERWGEAIGLMGDLQQAAKALVQAKEAANKKANEKLLRAKYESVKQLMADASNAWAATEISDDLESAFVEAREKYSGLAEVEVWPDDASETVENAEKSATALLLAYESTDHGQLHKLYTPAVQGRQSMALQVVARTKSLKDLMGALVLAKQAHERQVGEQNYAGALETETPALIGAIEALLKAAKTDPRDKIESKTTPLTEEQGEAILGRAKPTANPNPLLTSAAMAKKFPEYVRPIAPVGTEDLLKAGLQPKHTITTPPGQNIHVSDPFDLGGGRVACIGYVELDGEVYVRSFYRSNSRGDWQCASHFGDVDDGKPKWIGKGVGGGKSSTVLPILVQKELCKIKASAELVKPEAPDGAQDVKYRKKGEKEDETIDVSAGERYFYGLLPFGASDEFKDEMGGVYVARKLAPMKGEVKDSTPLKARVQVAKEDLPNFETAVDSFDVELFEHYKPPCKAFVFDGAAQEETDTQPAKQLRYMFVRDGAGAVFLSGVEDIAAPTNSFGVATRSMEPGILGTGLIEYEEMMDDAKLSQYKGDKVTTEYVGVKPEFHAAIPLVAVARDSIEKLTKNPK